MKSSMTFIRGNRCIEREKDNVKSREVKRLKECALALNLCYYSYIIARVSDVGLSSLFVVALQYFTFSSSRMHIFKHSVLCTLASRRHYLVLLALTFRYIELYCIDIFYLSITLRKLNTFLFP